MKYGANHDPASPALAFALDYGRVKVSGPARVTPLPSPDWFNAWRWPATGNALGNDELSNCCEAADLVLVEGFRAMRGLPPLSGDVLKNLAVLRYEQIAGYDGTAETDDGSVPAEDCFAWQTAAITVGDKSWAVRWLSVRPEEAMSALRRGPLQVTLALTEADDDPATWRLAPTGPPTAYHRVVAGAAPDGFLTCRTWGMDVAVNLTRVVAADLLVSVTTPETLRTAGLDWKTLLA